MELHSVFHIVWSIRCPLRIGTIFSKIDQYLDLPHRLSSFRALVHTLTLAGMGDYRLEWSGLCNFLKIHGLTHLSDAFFNADHVEFIEIYNFSKKFGAPASIFWFNNNIKVKSFKW